MSFRSWLRHSEKPFQVPSAPVCMKFFELLLHIVDSYYIIVSCTEAWIAWVGMVIFVFRTQENKVGADPGSHNCGCIMWLWNLLSGRRLLMFYVQGMFLPYGRQPPPCSRVVFSILVRISPMPSAVWNARCRDVYLLRTWSPAPVLFLIVLFLIILPLFVSSLHWNRCAGTLGADHTCNVCAGLLEDLVERAEVLPLRWHSILHPLCGGILHIPGPGHHTASV